jgi:hypothetical protein
MVTPAVARCRVSPAPYEPVPSTPTRANSPNSPTHASSARYPARVVEKLRVPSTVSPVSITAATCSSLWVSTPAYTTRPGLLLASCWRVGAAVVMLVMSFLRSARACGTAASRIDRTGGQDSDEHLVAQALLRSPRRRGVTPHRALPEHRQIRGKTTPSSIGVRVRKLWEPPAPASCRFHRRTGQEPCERWHRQSHCRYASSVALAANDACVQWS